MLYKEVFTMHQGNLLRGSKVALKSGGPDMTIISDQPFLSVLAQWEDDDGKLRFETFGIESVTPVEPEKD